MNLLPSFCSGGRSGTVCALALFLAQPLLAQPPESGQAFKTPEAAVAALARATAQEDAAALRTLFGPKAADPPVETGCAM